MTTEAKKPRENDGFIRRMIRIQEADWTAIEKYAEKECLDVDKWLTKEMAEIAKNLEQPE